MTRTSSTTRSAPGRMAALTVLVLLSGCGSETSPGQDHVGHVIPAHKPRTFSEAVRSLKSLDESLALASGAPQPGDQTLEKAIDVAGWLPEVAAESDMPEGPWEEVDRLAGALVSAYRSRRASPGRGEPTHASQGLVAELEKILEQADPHWFDLPPVAEQGSPESVTPAGTPLSTQHQ
ncbi:MAG: hypothetical protein U0790_03260 [Isosphaeraceae bacterium]